MIRLAFDARGEYDLRHPLTSTMAVVTLEDDVEMPMVVAASGTDMTSALGSCMEVAGVPAGSNGQPMVIGWDAGMGPSEPPAATRGWAEGGGSRMRRRPLSVPSIGILGSNDLAMAEVPRRPPLKEVHCSLLPSSCKLCLSLPNHFKGILQWEDEAAIAQLLGHLQVPGRALVFCFACDLSSSLAYAGMWPDYTSSVLLVTLSPAEEAVSPAEEVEGRGRDLDGNVSSPQSLRYDEPYQLEVRFHNLLGFQS